MSGLLQGCVWYLSDLSTSEKAVLAALADHAEDDGTRCFPSMDRLAWKVSMTDRGVRKIIARLEELGYLTRRINRAGEPDGSTPNGYKTNIFELNIPNRVPAKGEQPWKSGGRPWEKTRNREEPEFRPAPPAEMQDSDEQGGTGVPPRAERGFRSGGNGGSAKTSVEPPTEPSVIIPASKPEAAPQPSAPAGAGIGDETNGATLFAVPPLPASPKQATPSGRKKSGPVVYSPGFLVWWKRYPGSGGDKRGAWAAWQHADTAALEVALDNYIASIAAFEARHPGATAPRMHATTFINGRYDDWADGLCFPSWPTKPDKKTAAEAFAQLDDIAAAMGQQIEETGRVPSLVDAYMRAPQAPTTTPPPRPGVIDVKEISA